MIKLTESQQAVEDLFLLNKKLKEQVRILEKALEDCNDLDDRSSDVDDNTTDQTSFL